MSSLINWALSLIDVTCVLSENVSAQVEGLKMFSEEGDSTLM